jgi:MYND finger
MEICDVCDNDAMHTCGACGQVAYCSVECQTADWPEHQQWDCCSNHEDLVESMGVKVLEPDYYIAIDCSNHEDLMTIDKGGGGGGKVKMRAPKGKKPKRKGRRKKRRKKRKKKENDIDDSSSSNLVKKGAKAVVVLGATKVLLSK